MRPYVYFTHGWHPAARAAPRGPTWDSHPVRRQEARGGGAAGAPRAAAAAPLPEVLCDSWPLLVPLLVPLVVGGDAPAAGRSPEALLPLRDRRRVPAPALDRRRLLLHTTSATAARRAGAS